MGNSLSQKLSTFSNILDHPSRMIQRIPIPFGHPIQQVHAKQSNAMQSKELFISQSKSKFNLSMWKPTATLRWLTLINFVAPILVANLAQLLFGSSICIAQSIGYQPSFTLGFNPYLSPVFGYGLGVPFGAYSFSPSKYPWLTSSITGSPFGQSSFNLLSKVHAKSFLKRILPNPYHGNLKNKLTLMKHPEYSFTPYGLDYGYGKHYGSAMLPNNPYKSTYIDYYNNSPNPIKTGTGQQNFDTLATNSIPALVDHNKSLKIIKPLIKAGALLTTAALLGKKSLDSYPIRLNPSGMILNGANI